MYLRRKNACLPIIQENCQQAFLFGFNNVGFCLVNGMRGES
jgi:hypothetical protein